MNKQLIIILAILATAAGLFTFKYVQTTKAQERKPELALLYPTPRLVHDFELTDHNGVRFTKRQLQNKWTLIFFGYTSCPDICPTTLIELNYIYPELKKITQDRVQVAFVTADPKRDTVEKLNAYTKYFNKEFIALRGGHDVLFPFARNIGLMYAIAEDTNQEYYLVNHSASIVLTNPAGNVQAIFKPVPSTTPGTVPSIDSKIMLKDFRKIYNALSNID